MQTPPLSARVTLGRVPRVLTLLAFVVGTLVSSLTLAPEPAAALGAAQTTSSLNLRAGPSTGYAVILVMPSGASLKITGSYNKGFYPVRYEGTKGWASADYLTTGGGGSSAGDSGASSSATGSANTTTSLNLRSGPSTGDSVVAVMPSGASVELTGQAANGFVSVNYQGSSGWAYEAYLGSGGGSGSDSGSGTGDNLPDGSAVSYATTTSSLNLRSNYSTSSRVLTVMPSGASVEILGDPVSGFYPVRYGGSTGWASADYLSSGGGSGDGSGDGSGSGSDGSWSQQEIIDLIYEAAAYYGQSGDDMLRVARCESNLDPYNVTPPYEASGLFQFLPGTWATTPYASQDIFDAEANAYAAAWMWSVGRRGEWVCQ